MKNVIVVSFKSEANAIEALHKLKDLELFGDISIYDKIMVRKNSDGTTEVLQLEDSEGWRTLTGMGVGSLLGLLGGPVGFVIGLYTGTAIGAIADASHYDFAVDFIAKIERKLEVGTVAIIAEIEEDNSVFIDNYLKPLGGVITRSDFDMEFDNHTDEEIDELEAEIAVERAELKKAIGNDKKKFQDKIAALQEKRRARIAELVAKSKQTQENVKDKVAGGFDRVKSDFESFKNELTDEMKRSKLERLRRRIDKHQDNLNTLNEQMKELQA